MRNSNISKYNVILPSYKKRNSIEQINSNCDAIKIWQHDKQKQNLAATLF